MTVKSIDDYKTVVESLIGPSIKYYRGQSDSDWKALPSIARLDRIKGISNETERISELRTLEKSLNERFESIASQMELRLSSLHHQTWELLKIAQHHGLPTRLLDFTHDIQVAFEFAVLDLHTLNRDGEVIVYYNPKDNGELPKSEFNQDIENEFFFQSGAYYTDGATPTGERRKFTQGSMFLYIPDSKMFQCVKGWCGRYVDRIIVDKSAKIPLIEHWLTQGNPIDPMVGSPVRLDYYATLLKLEASEGCQLSSFASHR